jgi:Type II secretion system (T2SS), protein E, N-terminal domain/GAF domain
MPLPEDGMSKQLSWEEHQQVRRTERRKAFFQRLGEVAERIDAAENIDELMLEVSRDIGTLFGCDRLTLYTVGASRMTLESKIKTGMGAFRDFELPIGTSSIAGHVALTRRGFNIHNVYDEQELRGHSRELRFLDFVDQRTGYRTREMLVLPILHAGGGELLGVLQLINNRLGGPFPELVEEGARDLCKVLALAFERHNRPEITVRGRFDPLVLHGALSRPELELARRTARRKQLELEDVLIDEFQVLPAQLGAAYAEFYGVPYEPFRAARAGVRLHENARGEYSLRHGWLLLDAYGRKVTVLALDPKRLRASRILEELFPAHAIRVLVTTRREFAQTAAQLYGGRVPAEDDDAEEALTRRIQQIVTQALASAAPELQAVVRPEHVRLLRSEAAEGDGKPRKAQVALRIDLKL